MDELRFPPGFHWGVATSAYQIEGGWDADGKGPSVWDTLAHRPGGLAGATGDVACDHYHRLAEDLDLMSLLGITSYRFSVSWPRVQPAGRGRWNPAGLDFYERLVDGLLARGIEPMLTLYHWDHPQALQDAGGWLNPRTADRFADYAEGVAIRLGDRVPRWITLNEPLSVLHAAMNGALGRQALPMARTMMVAHGLAVGRLRGLGVTGEIGIALNLAGIAPATPEDVDAAERARAFEDRLFLDPLCHGHFPVLDGRPVLDADLADSQIMSVPIDFLGVNWYAPARVATSPSGYTRVDPHDMPKNMLGWPVAPDHLGHLLAWLRTNYPRLSPVHITENGIPLPDTAAGEDEERIRYLHGCLTQLRQAIDAGTDIRGYHVWSFMDNLEWDHGYRPRFGLVHVDFDTLARTPKASFHWYRGLISAQRRMDTSCSG